MTDYEQKYIKYKTKYCDLKQQLAVQEGVCLRSWRMIQ